METQRHHGGVMTRLRAGQIWRDVHSKRKDRVVQIRVVASDFVVVTSSNNRTTRIARKSFSPRSRLRFEYLCHQPDPKVTWDDGLQATAAQLREIGNGEAEHCD